MSIRSHIQSRHEVEYAPGAWFTGSLQPAVYGWLTDAGVYVQAADGDENAELAAEWEILKEELAAIPDYAYDDIGFECSPDDMRAFVAALLDAPTGAYAYVSWF